MRQMRNKRSGKLAVYDPDIVAGGSWEEYIPPQKIEKKPWNQDEVKPADVATIRLIRSDGESSEYQA